MDILEFLLKCTGFEWDKNNSGKIWLKHKVTPMECEQAFFNMPLVVADDKTHSAVEARFYSLGVTDESRKLFIVFTTRKNRIRVISARDMSRSERKVFETHEEKDS